MEPGRDAGLSMKEHVNTALSDLSDQFQTSVADIMSSHLDYYNAVFYGVTDVAIRPLRYVLHAVARLTTGVRRNVLTLVSCTPQYRQFCEIFRGGIVPASSAPADWVTARESITRSRR